MAKEVVSVRAGRREPAHGRGPAAGGGDAGVDRIGPGRRHWPVAARAGPSCVRHGTEAGSVVPRRRHQPGVSALAPAGCPASPPSAARRGVFLHDRCITLAGAAKEGLLPERCLSRAMSTSPSSTSWRRWPSSRCWPGSRPAATSSVWNRLAKRSRRRPPRCRRARYRGGSCRPRSEPSASLWATTSQG